MNLLSKSYLRESQYRDASNLDARAALHKRFSVNSYPWHRWVFDLALAVAPSDTAVLEVGAGSALLWTANRERVPCGWLVTLTDFSPGMLDAARKTLASDAARFTFAQADVEDLPFDDGAFDVVIANHMLYHVPDRPNAFAQIARVLRPGGVLLAATNGSGNLDELTALIAPEAPEAIEWRERFARGFTLENGAEQLRQVFGPVDLHERAGGLAVTEAEPLVAYIAAMDYPSLRDSQRFSAVEARVRDHLAVQGTLHLTNRVGIFIARR